MFSASCFSFLFFFVFDLQNRLLGISPLEVRDELQWLQSRLLSQPLFRGKKADLFPAFLFDGSSSFRDVAESGCTARIKVR